VCNKGVPDVFLIKQYIIHYNMQVHRICLSCLKLEHYQKYCFLLFNIYMYLFNLSIIIKFDPYRLQIQWFWSFEDHFNCR